MHGARQGRKQHATGRADRVIRGPLEIVAQHVRPRRLCEWGGWDGAAVTLLVCGSVWECVAWQPRIDVWAVARPWEWVVSRPDERLWIVSMADVDKRIWRFTGRGMCLVMGLTFHQGSPESRLCRALSAMRSGVQAAS